MVSWVFGMFCCHLYVRRIRLVFFLYVVLCGCYGDGLLGFWHVLLSFVCEENTACFFSYMWCYVDVMETVSWVFGMFCCHLYVRRIRLVLFLICGVMWMLWRRFPGFFACFVVICM